DGIGEKPSLIDLPNEILTKIISYLDIPSRLKLRVNKRLDQLELTVMNHTMNIFLNISDSQFAVYYSHSVQKKCSDIRQLSSTLKRLAENTIVRNVHIMGMTHDHTHLLSSLQHFHAYRL
ncbi:hypothetical protein PFISCL1PPCAC_18740, partial [Pristionchus fissidentatus]